MLVFHFYSRPVSDEHPRGYDTTLSFRNSHLFSRFFTHTAESLLDNFHFDITDTWA